MSTTISSLGTEIQTLLGINSGQQQMTSLSDELSTGLEHNDLSQYTAQQQGQIYSLGSSISQIESYQTINGMVTPTINLYDSTLTDITSVTNQLQSLVNLNATSGTGTTDTSQLATQIQSYMTLLQDDLNQQDGNGNYIFAGSRAAGVAPVGDLNSLPVPPTETGPTTSPTLPIYDSQSGGTDTTSDQSAYDTQTAVIDTGYTMNYGISSDNPAFQNVVLAMRYAYAATQDPSNYNSYMSQAQSLITTALPQLQQIQSQNADNLTALNSTSTSQASLLSELNTQLSGIQDADTTSVAVQITNLQTQIEASYSATAILSQLSLSKYITTG